MPYRRRRACGAGSSATWGWTSGWGRPCRGRGPGRGPGRPPCSCWAGWRGTELLLLMNTWCRWETGTGEPPGARSPPPRRHQRTEPRHSGAGRGWRRTRDTWARGDTRGHAASPPCAGWPLLQLRCLRVRQDRWLVAGGWWLVSRWLGTSEQWQSQLIPALLLSLNSPNLAAQFVVLMTASPAQPRPASPAQPSQPSPAQPSPAAAQSNTPHTRWRRRFAKFYRIKPQRRLNWLYINLNHGRVAQKPSCNTRNKTV